MDDPLKSDGKKYVILALAISIIPEILGWFYTGINLIRLLVTLIFVYLIYRGLNWARWLYVAFMLLGALLAGYSLSNIGFAHDSAFLFVIILVCAIVTAFLLVFPQSVANYFGRKKA